MSGPLDGEAFHSATRTGRRPREGVAKVADVRADGTTHERLVDRFAPERGPLVPAAGRSFQFEAPLRRVAASDYLVSVDQSLLGAVHAHRAVDGGPPV